MTIAGRNHEIGLWPEMTQELESSKLSLGTGLSSPCEVQWSGLQRFGLSSPRLVSPMLGSQEATPSAKGQRFCPHKPALVWQRQAVLRVWVDDGSLALRRLCTVPKTSVHLLSRKESERKRKGEGRCRRRRARAVILFPCTAKVPLFRRIKSLRCTRYDEGTKVDDALGPRNEKTSSRAGNESTANHSLERDTLQQRAFGFFSFTLGRAKSRDDP